MAQCSAVRSSQNPSGETRRAQRIWKAFRHTSERNGSLSMWIVDKLSQSSEGDFDSRLHLHFWLTTVAVVHRHTFDVSACISRSWTAVPEVVCMFQFDPALGRALHSRRRIMRYLLAVQELAMDLSSDWIDECLWKRDVGGIDRNREPLLRDGLILQQWLISIHRPPTPPRLHSTVYVGEGNQFEESV